MTEKALEGNLALLLVTSSDTILSSLVWLFRIMCKYPDIQEKVYTELMEILGKDGQAKYEERDNIPYTFAVLVEGQRYASISPLSPTRRHLIVTKGTVQIFLFNSIMEAIEKFKSKRKVVRTASTKLVNQITLLLESYDIKKEKDRKKLSEYLLNVEDKLKELKTLNKEIEELITDKAVFEADIETSFEYEENLNDLRFQIKSKIDNFKIEQQPVTAPPVNIPANNAETKRPATSISLPKLRIPTFSGDASTFLEFINSFSNAIDSNESLNNVEKFIYLKSFLSGEAYKSVSGFSLTEENYKSCLDLLKDRYGRQDHLIGHFINKLLEIKPVKSSFNLRGLRKLHDESEISIRNLNSMGIDSKNSGHLLIPILLKQLPHDLVIEYHRKRNSGKTGDVHELIKFIKFEIESRESANIVTGHTHKVSESRQFSRNSSYHGQPKIKPNAPSSAALNTVVKKCVHIL
ncbi:hypothetical protein AVEN_194224-1 [Araneus ventricosus]|uniref:Cytochrome P450 n=1 Tax=Araneus ventricosus TaxID=182803 RepID=A0A4Y2HGK4_ARAVE|nr:hypothetical protein AVEN_194224-1 [Araneus ventricosus]